MMRTQSRNVLAIGERIRQVREQRVWGQAELARKAGISANTLYRIEAGRHVPRPATIRKLAQALGVSPETLAWSLEQVLAEAPIDDEPETPEEAAAVQEAREALARGDVVSWDEVKRRFGSGHSPPQ